jgi:uncharacterized protein (DUF433 family)
MVLRLVEEGLTFAQIKEEYPERTNNDIHDIHAAIRYAQLTVEAEEIYPLRAQESAKKGAEPRRP